MMIANDDKIMMNGMVPRIFMFCIVLFLVLSKQKQNKKSNGLKFYIYSVYSPILIFWITHTQIQKKSACSN